MTAGDQEFRLAKTSLVAIGAFNVYIIHPQWLEEVEAIANADEYALQINFTQPGIRLVPKDGVGATWTIRPDRLLVEASQPNGTEWESVKSVLMELPWTPLTAVGTNFYFDGPSGEFARLSKLDGQPGGSVAGYPLKSRSYQLGLVDTDSDALRNVHLTERGRKTELIVNFHTEFSGAPVQKQPEAVSRAIGDFSQRHKEAKTLVSSIYGIAVQ